MRTTRWVLPLLLLWVGAGGCPPDAAAGKRGKVVRLLTIGNSFAHNATRYLPELVEASRKHTLILGKANLGGCSLERHWRHVEQHEADPETKEGQPYGGRSLKQILRADAWDVVTIQQYSWLSHDVDTYRPYAGKLHAYVAQHAPQAKVMFHQTWAYRTDDTGRLKDDYTQADMHRDVHDAYHTIAGELRISIVPVGEAFARARGHARWNFERDPDFDYEEPEHPALPEEKHSLCRGWHWQKKDGRWRLVLDTHHAGPAGEYLAAAVFYEVLFADSVTRNRFVPKALSRKDATLLRRIAHDTVRDPSTVEPRPVGAAADD